MSVFDRIRQAIFGEAHAAPAGQASNRSGTLHSSSPATQTVSASVVDKPSTVSTPPIENSSSSATLSAAPSSGETSQSSGTEAAVDVEAILTDAVKKSGQKLDWRHSIVDMMKALGMDASLEERRELATELGYPGDANDSVKMNIYLHKALMKKLSENGGKVPAELLN